MKTKDARNSRENRKECPMDTQINEVVINDKTYVLKESIQSNTPAESVDGMRYVICRTCQAGVFAGYLKESSVAGGVRTSVLLKARRLWYWSGASSLSQLSMEGVKNPDLCKFPCEVEEIELTNVIETTPATKIAKDSIAGVPVWKQ